MPIMQYDNKQSINFIEYQYNSSLEMNPEWSGSIAGCIMLLAIKH
jgi:hypothetical protein